MNTLPSHSAVIIVGAGPSGLMMAAQLLRFGINPIIIDSKTALTTESRALAVQARSLEILRQMGLDERALEEGNIAKGMIIHQDYEEMASVNLSAIGEGKSPFPYVLILEQSKTERILIDYLTANACPVFWNTKLLDVHPTDKLVNLKISRNDVIEIVSCDWLIAADGVSSTVRKSLRIAFSGGTYGQKFFLSDIKSKEDVSADAVRAYFSEKGFTAIFPMKDSNYRFIGIVPKSLEQKPDINFKDLKPYLTYNLGFPVTDDCCNWFSTYQVHHRIAERFSVQRCFLIGDAAHVHSPVGGQGMNTGLQDAYNLAWKLAGVIEKKYPESILDTYAAERMPVAKRLLKTTDRLFSFIIGQSWFFRKLKNIILSFLATRAFKGALINQKIFGLISQTEINYRHSPLTVHHSALKNIKAGDRLPYIKLFDEKLKEETDLHEWCTSSSFNIIVIGQLSQRDLLAMVKWIKLTYPIGLDFFYLPPSKRNQHVFDFFDIPENGKKALIVRPDMHIGYINDVVDIELLSGYLENSIGWR